MEKRNLIPDDMEFDCKLGRFRYRNAETADKYIILITLTITREID